MSYFRASPMDTAMQEAKRRGCTWYDFFGVGPVKSGVEHFDVARIIRFFL